MEAPAPILPWKMRWFGRLSKTSSTFVMNDFGKTFEALHRRSEQTLWMDELLHHFETMGHHCLWEFTGESSFQGFKWCRISTIFYMHIHSPSSFDLLVENQSNLGMWQNRGTPKMVKGRCE